MAQSRTATDRLHDSLNPYFHTRSNLNWKAIIEAIGNGDQDIADLVRDVREQFFVATADRPYLDRLGTNVGVTRPRVVGMDDPTLRKYIPILAYQPKQVKLIMDQLLDIFFFREATTAFVESVVAEPFLLKDGWELVYKVDATSEENIVFAADEFADISAATAEEIAASINRQAKYSFAVAFDNRILKQTFIRIFTKTVGSKGSIESAGGRANISLQLNGFISGAGSGATTTWSISKIGDTVTFEYTGGSLVNLNQIQAGDLVVIDMPGNSGTFEVTEINLSSNYFKFINLFATSGTFDHAVDTGYYVRFIRPQRSVVWTRTNRAVVWEVNPGEVVIEMPATPPVVRRTQIGSAHLNGLVELMMSRDSDTSLTINDASEWPETGMFSMAPEQEVQHHILTGSEDTNTATAISGRYDASGYRFTYTGKSGNQLTGISPSLPQPSGIFEYLIASISRDAFDNVTVTTSLNHNFTVGRPVRVYDVTGGSNFNGTWEVQSVPAANQFVYKSFGVAESGVGGETRGEQVGLANSGSLVYLMSALVNTGLYGPYLWDTAAPFVLSSYTGTGVTDIKAGNIVLNLQIDTPNNIPNEQGYLIFDYGLETEEGPVRYLYKASDSTLALDPAYVFQFNHPPGSSITAIRRRGAQIMGGLGAERSFYVSDPGAARAILQDLLKDVKSAGIFLRYLVRYPTLYYSAFDTYGSTADPLD